jgi:hypothetical protein
MTICLITENLGQGPHQSHHHICGMCAPGLWA